MNFCERFVVSERDDDDILVYINRLYYRLSHVAQVHEGLHASMIGEFLFAVYSLQLVHEKAVMAGDLRDQLQKICIHLTDSSLSCNLQPLDKKGRIN